MVNQDITLQVITSQYFGQVYYVAIVWLSNNLNYNLRKRLETEHYRVIHAAGRDKK